jgi:hypothetical protein
MKQQVFEELAESVRQLGEIMRGERKPSRQFELEAPRRDDPPQSVEG